MGRGKAPKGRGRSRGGGNTAASSSGPARSTRKRTHDELTREATPVSADSDHTEKSQKDSDEPSEHEDGSEQEHGDETESEEDSDNESARASPKQPANKKQRLNNPKDATIGGNADSDPPENQQGTPATPTPNPRQTVNGTETTTPQNKGKGKATATPKSGPRGTRTRTAGSQLDSSRPVNLGSEVPSWIKREGTVASHLGYTDIGTWRRFSFSPWVVDWLTLWLHLDAPNSDFAQQALKALHKEDHDLDTPSSKTRSLASIWVKYAKIRKHDTTNPATTLELPPFPLGEITKLKLKYDYVILIKLFIRGFIQATNTWNVPSDEELTKYHNQMRIKHVPWIVSYVTPAKQKGVTPTQMPNFEPFPLVKPKFGPYVDLGETADDSYYRVANWMKAMKERYTPQRLRDLSGKEPFASLSIAEDNIFGWLRSDYNPHPDPLEGMPIQPELPDKTFNFIYETKTPGQAAIMGDYRDAVQEMAMEWERTIQLPRCDPRTYKDGAIWRDDVRRELRLHELPFDLEYMAWGDDRDSVMFMHGAAKWERAIKILDEQGGDSCPIYYRLSRRSGGAITWETPAEVIGKTVLQPSVQGLARRGRQALAKSTRDYQQTVAPGSRAKLPEIQEDAPPEGAQSHLLRGERTSLVVAAPALMGREDMEILKQKWPKLKYHSKPTIHLYRTIKELFGKTPDKQVLAKHFGARYDVTTPAGLQRWQEDTFAEVINLAHPDIEQIKAPNGVLLADFEALQEVERNKTNLSVFDVTLQNMKASEELRRAVEHNPDNVGPCLDDAVLLMDAVRVGTHRGEISLWKVGIVNTTRTFLDTQLTGAVWLVCKCFGKFPLEPARYAGNPMLKKQLKDAQKRTMQLKTRGGLLQDSTGLGKTSTLLLAHAITISISPEQRVKLLNLPEGNLFRPTLILAPSAAVLFQWIKELEHYPGLESVLMWGTHSRLGEKLSGTKTKHLQSKVVSSGPSPEYWPPELDHIRQTSDPRAAKTVILATYDTFSRLKGAEYKELEAVEDDHIADKERNKAASVYVLETITKGGRSRHLTWVSKWIYFFEKAIFDEAHLFRNPGSQTFANVFQMGFELSFMATATPIINEAVNLVAYARILWVQVSATFKRAKLGDWACELAHRGYHAAYQELAKFLETDEKRLSLLDPCLMRNLMTSDEYVHITKHFPLIEKALLISRSPMSSIPKDHEGKVMINLKNIMPPYSVQTHILRYQGKEGAESQATHRRYSDLIQDISKRNIGKEPNANPAPVAPRVGAESTKDKATQNFPPITAELRQLSINTSSVLLSRLQRERNELPKVKLWDKKLKKYAYKNLGTSVDEVSEWRKQGYGLEWLVGCTWGSGDGPLKTRADVLKFACYGSPKARMVLKIVRDVVVRPIGNNKPKFIMVVDNPVVGYFYEQLLNFSFVKTVSIHAGIDSMEREVVIAELTDKNSDLDGVVFTSSINMQGINLHPACNVVVIETAGRSRAQESQMYGRVVRTPQDRPSFIYRLRVEHSHDEWRDSRQQEKALVELMTRTNHPAARDVLLQLLNHPDADKEVCDAHDGSLAQALRDTGLDELYMRFLDPTARDKAMQDDADEKTSQFGLTMRNSGKAARNEALTEAFAMTHLDASPSGAPQCSSNATGPQTLVNTEIAEHQDINLIQTEENEDGDDDDEGIVDLVRSPGALAFRRLYSSLEIEQQRRLNQGHLNTLFLQQFIKGRTYVVQDLKTPLILERAVRLLFEKMYGLVAPGFRVSTHVDYVHLENDKVQPPQQARRVGSSHPPTRNQALHDPQEFVGTLHAATHPVPDPTAVPGNGDGGGGVGGEGDARTEGIDGEGDANMGGG